MSRVFVVQNQHRWDQTNGCFVPKFDMSPAQVFGDLVDLLSPTASPFNPEPILRDLREKLKDYSDGDYILCVGNPILIAWSFAIAADVNGGTAAALQWSGKDQRYLPVSVTDFFGTDDQ